MKLAKVKGRWLAPTSAVLALAAFDPINLSPLVFLALAPLFLRLADAEVRPFRCGFGFGLIYGLGQFVWIGQLTEWWTQSFWLALVPVAIAVPLFALYFGLAGWLIARCWRLGLAWLIPLAWAGVEVFRSYIPAFAFPWGLIASPLWRFPCLIQSGHFFTIYGVGALVALVNVILCIVLRERKFEPVRAMTAVAVACVAVPFALSLLPDRGTPMRVTAGQLGISLAGPSPVQAQDKQANPYLHVGDAVDKLEASAVRDQSRLLILPEGVVIAGDDSPPKTSFRLDPNLPVIFGAERGESPTYQSAFAYDGKWSYADKTRLVIFGEFVPRWIPFLSAFHLASGDLSSGSQVTALHVGEVTVGPLICFEGLFPDLAYRQSLNGAQVLSVMSMDDWFMGTPALDQLRAGSVWRAVETGLPLVRAATTGYSLICDGHGNVLAEADLHDRSALTEEIRVPPQAAVWWLPVFPLTSLLACVVIVVKRPKAI